MFFTAFTLVFTLLGAPQEDAAPAWEWKKPEGAEQYAAAKKDFEAGKYSAAGKAFSSLRKLAKDKATKKEVALYRAACEGGIKLGVYAKKAKSSKYKAYLDASKNAPKYVGTPIQKKYDDFIAQLRADVFQEVENFDRSGSRFLEKNGKTFIKDEKWVKQGTQSLKWVASGDNISLKVKGRSLPDDLTPYAAISLWVCFPQKKAPFSLAFRCRGSSKENTQNAMVVNAFVKTLPGHKGWKRVEVPLKGFRSQGKTDWKNIKDFRIEFNGPPNLTLYLDDITLIKK